MSMQNFYVGYSGILWQTVSPTLALYNQQLAAAITASGGASGTSATTVPTNAQLALMGEATFFTLQNAAECINVQALYNAWNYETSQLQAIALLALPLDAGTQTIFTNRLIVYEQATAAIQLFINNPPYRDPSVIINGTPSVAAPGILKFFRNFDYETPPIVLDGTLLTQANVEATAWMTVANAILAFQGNAVTQLYDAAIREYQCASLAAYLINNLINLPPSTTALWNQLGTLPAMMACGNVLSSAPFSATNQQNAVLRNLMLALSGEIAQLLLVLERPSIQQQIASVTLMQGQSLQDVAAAVTGNADNWVEIAALNNLSPPYVVSSLTTPTTTPGQFGVGVVGPGSTILVPTPGVSLSSVGAVPDYNTQFLGTDIYVGPINGSMPNWQGDFQTITGYPNLLWALGRRLQTTQGTLIYHTSYGSRIPPEVGNLLTDKTAGHIAVYGTNALKADPRVAKVQNASATLQAGQIINFVGTVIPGGFNPTPVTINEVIG